MVGLKSQRITLDTINYAVDYRHRRYRTWRWIFCSPCALSGSRTRQGQKKRQHEANTAKNRFEDSTCANHGSLLRGNNYVVPKTKQGRLSAGSNGSRVLTSWTGFYIAVFGLRRTRLRLGNGSLQGGQRLCEGVLFVDANSRELYAEL